MAIDNNRICSDPSTTKVVTDFAMCGSPNTSVLRPLAGKDEDDQLVVDGDVSTQHLPPHLATIKSLEHD